MNFSFKNKFTDIVNRDIVTLTNCEHEPIHIPGSIQPHGFLIAVNEDNFTVDFCSGNISSYLGLEYTDILGKRFSKIFSSDNEAHIKSHLSTNKAHQGLPLDIVMKKKNFRLMIHKSGPVYILEAEESFADKDTLAEVYLQTAQFVSYMNTTSSLQELCSLVVQSTRRITGYDRVMVYRFDEDYNGEIFAESCNDTVEPFIGLHYPQSDIPVQARELYMKNLMRLIVDVSYTPVPIFTVDNGESKNLDLSLSTLRSTSPIHVEYLANMGVGATLTISLMHQGRLWGLIACHHYSPKNIAPEIRLAAQLQGQFITSQIDVRQSREEYDVARKSNIALEVMSAYNLPSAYDSFKAISESPELLHICNAAGVSILVNGRIYKNGITPASNDIRFYSNWLAGYTNDKTFHTHKEIDLLPTQDRETDEVCGIIYHSLGHGNSIMWYRPETVAEVTWAGDPSKSIVHDDKGMHPRKSFDLWKEIIKNQSSPWLQPELNAAANYAHVVQKQISTMHITQEEEKYRSLSEVLQETNAELENINYISSHDLQEPLRKIQMVASIAMLDQVDVPSENMIASLNKMTASAKRMQTLLVDILIYTKVKQTSDAFENISLDEIMTHALGEMKDSGAVITYDPLPKIVGIPFLLKQLFSNIMRNSIKYAASDRTPVIKVTASKIPEINHNINSSYCHWITFTDNGIGFEQKYAETIFKVFTRLHGRGSYEGSGVGLALCKKIMEINNGSISAIGVLGQGAAITIYFPYDK
jgi:chemotaxis family two-component system sensor kinase Cph1